MGGPDSESSASPGSRVIDASPARSGRSFCRMPTRAISPGNNLKPIRRHCSRAPGAYVRTGDAAPPVKAWRCCKGSSSAAGAVTA